MIDGVVRLKGDEWEIPKGFVPGMRVPARFFLSDTLAALLEPGAVQQLANVATLPGIVRSAYGMPDIHWGYGFPIGGVAAFTLDEGIVSPGGVGFDINCGVRLFTTPLAKTDLKKPRELVESLYKAVPTGVGAKSTQKISPANLTAMMEKGARFVVEAGFGVERDIERCEDRGCMKQADIRAVSAKARARGIPQGGTLGSGNHFLEVQEVSEIYDDVAAQAFGLKVGQVCCMIHCGSRGLGHQVCTDHLKDLVIANKKIPESNCPTGRSPAHRSGLRRKSYFGAWQASATMLGKTGSLYTIGPPTVHAFAFSLCLRGYAAPSTMSTQT